MLKILNYILILDQLMNINFLLKWFNYQMYKENIKN